MSIREITIKGANFKFLKLNVLDQFHIGRKLAPMLGDMIAASVGLKKDSSLEDQFKTLLPIMDGISKLSKNDSEEVFLGLLNAVEMQQSNNWAKVAVDKLIMFDTLGLPTLLQLAGRAFQFNMGGFFEELLQAKASGGSQLSGK